MHSTQFASVGSRCPLAVHRLQSSSIQRQRVCCCVAKTTRGRREISSRSSGTSTSVEDEQARHTPRKSVQEHARDVQQRLSSFVQYLTPKQEGDAGDVFMILVSLAVFIYLAMQLYRMYYYVYLQLGVMDMMS